MTAHQPENPEPDTGYRTQVDVPAAPPAL